MRKTVSIMIAVTLAIGAGSAIAKKSEDLPEVTEEGLERVHDSEWAVVYAQPGATLAGYRKVQLLEPYVSFRKDWRRDYNRSSTRRINTSDMEKIKTRMAREFDQVFREVLSEDDGYPIVDSAGDDVLLLRPAIVDLNPTAPDLPTASRSYTFARSAGSMSIYLEIYDSVTGDLIAKGLDSKADRDVGYHQWANSVSNKAAADRILRSWAKDLRDALDRAHEATGES